MAINIGKTLISGILFIFLILSIGCSASPQEIECPDCNCLECPTKVEICQQCSYPEMGCVDANEVNSLLNLTNKLIVIYNNVSEQEPINELDYYQTLEGGP